MGQRVLTHSMSTKAEDAELEFSGSAYISIIRPVKNGLAAADAKLRSNSGGYHSLNKNFYSYA
jgi:hypothetical protein